MIPGHELGQGERPGPRAHATLRAEGAAIPGAHRHVDDTGVRITDRRGQIGVGVGQVEDERTGVGGIDARDGVVVPPGVTSFRIPKRQEKRLHGRGGDRVSVLEGAALELEREREAIAGDVEGLCQLGHEIAVEVLGKQALVYSQIGVIHPGRVDRIVARKVQRIAEAQRPAYPGCVGPCLRQGCHARESTHGTSCGQRGRGGLQEACARDATPVNWGEGHDALLMYSMYSCLFRGHDRSVADLVGDLERGHTAVIPRLVRVARKECLGLIHCVPARHREVAVRWVLGPVRKVEEAEPVGRR